VTLQETAPPGAGGDKRPSRRIPRTPQLDGLRGVAIAAVALFHYPSHSIFQGGLFGVGIFFVLSGFLVTPILADDVEGNGRVRMGNFMSRRAWRLLPALTTFLAFFLIMDAAFGGAPWFGSSPFGPGGPGTAVPLPLALKGVGAALSYTYNEFLAWNAPMPQPLGHLWTLAVEGQFYVLWALLLPPLLRRGRAVFSGVLMAVIGASAFVPFLVYAHGSHQNWIYFATLPRLQELLAGALLSELWAMGVISRIPAPVLHAGALVGAAGMVYLVFGVGNQTLKYLGALTVVAACGFLLIPYLVDGRCHGWLKRALGSPAAVWLGKRSYAMYLWHWPLAEWTNLLPHIWGEPLGLACSLVAAEASWRLVEVPAQRLGGRVRRTRAQQAERGASRRTVPSAQG
jgi:peptidoglycan/LPS O-acetylase OafA/YrhL